MAICYLREKFSWCLLGCMLLTLNSCSSNKEDKKEGEVSKEEIKSLSETMGYLVFENIQSQHLKMDIDSLIQGIENARTGGTPPLSKEEFAQLLMKYRESLVKVQGVENLKIAQDFLSENKTAEGVVTLNDDKLQYIVLRKGNGVTVTEEDMPLVEYEGKLLDGKVFDSTKQRGQPIALPLKGTIPGFKTAVAGMKEGEIRKIFIHPDLAYGTKGRLPPNSLLIFEVEVVKAKGKSPNQQDAEYEREEGSSEEESAKSHEEDTGFQWLRKLRGAFF